MVTSNEVLERFYTILNVSVITDLIDGEIYLSEKPKNTQLQDIVINSLTNPNDRVVDGYVNINCYCKALNSQVPNMPFFKLVVKAITDLIDDEFLQETSIIVETDTLFRDNGDNEMFYNNIRVNYQIH